MTGDLQGHLPTRRANHSAVSDQNGITPMSHPPYSPDLTSSDFSFWFPQMNKDLTGKRFTNVEEVKQKNGRSTKRHQNQRVQKLF